jgi:hypothetical protein
LLLLFQFEAGQAIICVKKPPVEKVPVVDRDERGLAQLAQQRRNLRVENLAVWAAISNAHHRARIPLLDPAGDEAVANLVVEHNHA